MFNFSFFGFIDDIINESGVFSHSHYKTNESLRDKLQAVAEDIDFEETVNETVDENRETATAIEIIE